MRSISPDSKRAVVLAAGFLIGAHLACGGGDRPDREPARGDGRPLRAVPAPTSPPTRLSIDVGGHPGPIASAHGAVWVAVNRGRDDSRLVRIDAAANRVVASTRVAGPLFQLAAGGGAVWGSGNFEHGDGVLYRVDTDTDAVAATIRFSGRNAGPVAAGEGAVWLVLTDRGGSSTSLARIDPATNSVERIVPLDGASGRYVDELATGQGAVWLLALRFGESGEQPGDVLRFDPGKNEIVATVHAEALNLGVGPGGVWVSGCVDCDQHRETFFAQKIDTVANAPVGPQVAVDGVSFGPLLVATDSVWFSGYGTQGETVAFRLDPDTHAIEPFLQLGDFLYTDAVLDERTDTLWVGAAPHSVVRADLEPAPSPTLGPGDGPSKPAVPLARLPYMGVSCDGRPNWIGCDRVGLYVYLDRHVARLSASIEGREVPMHPAHGGLDARYNWEGFLRPAGLIDGPLNVRPERGRYYWFGKTPVSGRVRLTIYSGNGASATRTLQLPLAPGYG